MDFPCVWPKQVRGNLENCLLYVAHEIQPPSFQTFFSDLISGPQETQQAVPVDAEIFFFNIYLLLFVCIGVFPVFMCV